MKLMSIDKLMLKVSSPQPRPGKPVARILDMNVLIHGRRLLEQAKKCSCLGKGCEANPGPQAERCLRYDRCGSNSISADVVERLFCRFDDPVPARSLEAASPILPSAGG